MDLPSVVAAYHRVVDDVVRTPLLAAPWAGGELWLKTENLQPIGAFKLRGALNAISRLPESLRARGVVTHSSGNHGQAVAWAARAAGIPAVVVMPDAAARVKIDATRELGAEVVLVDGSQREHIADVIRARRDMTFIPPYDHPDVIAGQGTIALEVLDDLHGVDTLLVPVGGGGLISGIAVATAALSPSTRVIGVESVLAADARDSMAAGRRVAWEMHDTYRTIADGTRAPVLGELTFPLMQRHVHGMLAVEEADILTAVAALARRAHLVVEPSGALGVAAYLAAPERYGRTVAILSGGNIEPDLLTRALNLPL